MKIYIDNEYKCYTEDGEGRKAVDVSGFDGRCDIFIEGYRFVPEGETWIRSDGVVFTGEMITPWRDYSELDNAQREYERQLLENYNNEKEELNTSYQEGINSI